MPAAVALRGAMRGRRYRKIEPWPAADKRGRTASASARDRSTGLTVAATQLAASSASSRSPAQRADAR